MRFIKVIVWLSQSEKNYCFTVYNTIMQSNGLNNQLYSQQTAILSTEAIIRNISELLSNKKLKKKIFLNM